MKPLPLPPVDAGARLAASRLGRALLDPTSLDAAAVRWARLLECPVQVEPLPPTNRAAKGVVQARAGLTFADGRAGVLTVDTTVLAGLMGALTGAPRRHIGPVPLSPTESGLFAYLALEWLGLLTPVPALAWIDGGAALWSPPLGEAALRWRIAVDGVVGTACWWLPLLPAQPRALRRDLPLTGRLVAGGVRVRRCPGAGDLVILDRPAQLVLGPRTVPLARRDARWIVAPASEVRMTHPVADLPLTVDAVVGRLTLTVAEASALAPGAVLPLAPDPRPEVRLMVGETVIAVGMLVDDDGRAAVQVTRVVGDPPA